MIQGRGVTDQQAHLSNSTKGPHATHVKSEAMRCAQGLTFCVNKTDNSHQKVLVLGYKWL